MPDTRGGVPRQRFDIPVAPPYRLDLTAAVLRRISTNVVDTFDAAGVYRRALLLGPQRTVVVEVVQRSRDRLAVTASGRVNGARLRDSLRRILAADVDVQPFLRASRGIPWLAAIAARMRGVHPPRYPTVWEACVNAVVFQQISLFAAGAIMHRFLERFGGTVEMDGRALVTFPEPAVVESADPATLRAAGLSAAKASTLVGVAKALSSRRLAPAQLERSSSAQAAALLQRCKGIGPWTAALVLLRGLGRLDVFPENDSGAARSLALLTTGQPADVQSVLGRLGDQRGMLYYHLLLARLEARGDLPSSPVRK